MSFNNPDRGGKETKFVSEAILQMTQKRKVQASFAASGENDERRRPYANLRDVLHMQARAFVSFCGRNSASLLYLAFEKIIQSRSRHARAASFVRLNRYRQEFVNALAG